MFYYDLVEVENSLYQDVPLTMHHSTHKHAFTFLANICGHWQDALVIIKLDCTWGVFVVDYAIAAAMSKTYVGVMDCLEVQCKVAAIRP